MASIIIREANDSKTKKDFVQWANRFYRDCPYYVPDLESSIRDSFDPKKNPGLEFSEVLTLVAYRDGKTVGRVMGIINYKANDTWKTQSVRFGYIDFIDDIEVSRALLQAVEQWGKSKGMDTIQGPLGITDYDKEGMLVSDFDRLGSMNTFYNYPYYPQHLEKLGYKKQVDWLQIRIKIPEEVPERYHKTAKLVREFYHLRIKRVTNQELYHEGWGQKVFDVFNASFAPLFGFSQFSKAQVEMFVHQYVPLIDKRLMPLVVNEKDEIIGVAITMGSLSHALRKSRGKLWPTGWIPLLKSLKFKHEDTIDLLLIGVLPQYQGMGVTALIFDELIPVYNQLHYKYAETGPQLEENFKELTQWKYLNPELFKRRRCYGKAIEK